MRGWKATIAALTTFLIGALVVALFHNFKVEERATTLALLLLSPLVVYAIVSGKLLELTAPGGFSAKFQAATQQQVKDSAKPLSEDILSLQTVQKRSGAEFGRIVANLKRGEPIALVLYFGRQGYYDAETLRQYLDALRRFDPELIVVLADNVSRRFIAMIDGAAFISLLDTERPKIMAAIESGEQSRLAEFPHFVFRFLPDSMTKTEALKEMRAIGTKKMVVVNDHGVCHAVVKRDDIVAHMLADLGA